MRPPVASHTFCRSPGGPPAAAMIMSPGWACSCSTPMIWPWVSTASVSVMTSAVSARSAALSAAVGIERAARSMPGAVRSSSCARQAVAAVRRAGTRGECGQGPFRVADDPVAPSRSASCTLTLMLAKRTSGLAKSEWEPVAKSVSREPTVRTRSASRASVFVAGVPSRPMPPSCHQALRWTAPLPAKVSATGIPTAAARRSSSAVGLGVDARRRRR